MSSSSNTPIPPSGTDTGSAGPETLRERLHAFLSSATQRPYLENSAWLIGERILRLAVALTVGVYVVRHLGPTAYGELSYAISLVGLFSVLATLGLPGIVVRELVKNPSCTSELLGTSFGLSLVGGLVAVGLIAVVTPLTNASDLERRMILIISLGLLAESFRTFDYYFQSIAKSRFVVQIQVAQLLISSVAKIVLIVTSAELVWFAVVALADAVFLALGLFINYHRTQPQSPSFLTWRFRRLTAHRLLVDAWPLVLSGFVVAIYMKIDQVMIREMLDAGAVGQYAAAVRLSEAWYFVPMLIAQSYFPAIVAAREESQEAMERRLQKLYNILIWLALAVAVVSMVAAERIVLFLFGAAFAESAEVLTIHIWAGVFVTAAVLRGRWFIAMNLQRYSFLTVLVGATLNVIGNLMLIPAFGMNGAAWSTLLARLLSFYVIAVVFRDIRPTIVSFHRAVFAPIGWLAGRGGSG